MKIRNPRRRWHVQLQRLVVAALAVAVSACADGPVTPAPHSSDLAPDGATFARAPMVDVCHRTGNGSYELLTVNGNALAAHLNHGDATPGTSLDQDCAPRSVDVTGTYTLRTLGGNPLPTLGNGELMISTTIVLDDGGACSLSGRARRAQEDPNGEIEEFTTPGCTYSLDGTALTLVLDWGEGDEEVISAELVGDEITLQIRIWDDGDGSAEEDAPFADAVFRKI